MKLAHHSVVYEPSQLHKHGDLSSIKPRQKMPTIYRHRRAFQLPQQQSSLWPKDNSYLRKRFDRDIELQRSSMLMKTGRTSEDNPQWMKVNFDSYRRSNYSNMSKHSHKEQRYYDILNNPKTIYNGRNEDNYFIKMQSEPRNKPHEMDLSILRKTMQHSQLIHGEVANKVGAVEFRDYTIPRPQLKIGSSSYVDTYSPF